MADDPTLHDIEQQLRSGAVAAALARIEAGLAAIPQRFELLLLLANASIRLEQFERARVALELALAQRPKLVPLRRQLSQVLNRLATRPGLPAADAGALLERALLLWPEHPAARYNLALALLEADPARVLELLAPLLAVTPEDAELCALQARAAARLGQATVLERCLPLLLARQDFDLVEGCAAQLAFNGAPGAAQASFNTLALRAPARVLATLAGRLALPACYRDAAELAAARSRYARGLAELPDVLAPEQLRRRRASLDQLSWSNFLLAYQGGADRELQCAYGDWLATAAATLLPACAEPPARPRRAGSWRIGLLSSFWRHCTVGAYFAAWLDALRGPGCELHLLALGPHHDDWTVALERRADHALRLGGPLAGIAAQVRALDLDLLLYPELGMDGRTLVLAALPLARRQWCGWGHPVSSGLPGIERFLGCAGMEAPLVELATAPGRATPHPDYREPLLLLPGLGTRYTLPARPPPASRADFGLPAAGVLLVLPSSAFKLHPEGDADLATLLAARRDAHAVLLQTEPQGAMARLRERLEAALRAAGASPAQLCWLPALQRPRFLQLLGVADLLLDPRHWSGGNTALDALHMGLPILARRGRFMRGRQSAAMLDALGLGECVLADDVPASAFLPALDDAALRQSWRQRIGERFPGWIADGSALALLRAHVEAALA